jgi:hypothetical protein
MFVERDIIYLVVRFTALLTLFCFVSSCVLRKVCLAFTAREFIEVGLEQPTLLSRNGSYRQDRNQSPSQLKLLWQAFNLPGHISFSVCTEKISPFQGCKEASL